MKSLYDFQNGSPVSSKLGSGVPVRSMKICGFMGMTETVSVSLQLHKLIPLDIEASMQANSIGIGVSFVHGMTHL